MLPKLKVKKIVTGGQTGVDRAAFDAALACGIEIAGYVPADRLAEDGRIPEGYENLIETESSDPAARTILNVACSDATLIISRGALKGGSRLTLDAARASGKPHLHLDLRKLTLKTAVSIAAAWLTKNGVETLNVAGPRASEDAEIYTRARGLLIRILRKQQRLSEKQ